MENVHVTVLLKEAIDGLELKPGETVVDATLGGGGHSLEIAKRFGDKIELMGLDLDPEAIKRAEAALSKTKAHYRFFQESFRNIDKVLDKAGKSTVDKVLFDLGLSSNQLEISGRGFSFQRDEPLLMTFTSNEGASEDQSDERLTAREIVNDWQEESIADIIYYYGEETFARRIAKAIVETRMTAPIETTFQLVEVVKRSTPFWYSKGRVNPATKTFQALRIAVNDELRALEEALEKTFGRLAPGGRMAVISFHSLEDRIVKHFNQKSAREFDAKLVTKKPIVPTKEEMRQNPRSRSAKLRILEK